MNVMDEVRPEFRFSQHDEIGAPVVEEPADEAGKVERHELMRDACRKAAPP